MSRRIQIVRASPVDIIYLFPSPCIYMCILIIIYTIGCILRNTRNQKILFWIPVFIFFDFVFNLKWKIMFSVSNWINGICLFQDRFWILTSIYGFVDYNLINGYRYSFQVLLFYNFVVGTYIKRYFGKIELYNI